MNDMSAVIVAKSDQVNADDFLAGPMTFTIEAVAISPGTEQPVSIKLANEHRVFRPCKSMSRVLVAAWGPDASAYAGRSLTLYRDPKIKWGGMEVGGIRISHMSDIEREMVMALTATKGKRTPYTVKPLQTQQRQPEAKPVTAEEWADKHVRLVNAANDLERLQAVQASGEQAMTKLANSNADLHGRVLEAYAARFKALSDAEDDPFGLPPLETGRADHEHGDQHDGTDKPE